MTGFLTWFQGTGVRTLTLLVFASITFLLLRDNLLLSEESETISRSLISRFNPPRRPRPPTQNDATSRNAHLWTPPTSPPVLPQSTPSSTCIQWGKLFGASLKSKFPKMDCKFAQNPICCSALESGDTLDAPDRIKQKKVKSRQYRNCVVTKEYFPSPYETHHLEKAEELALIPDIETRTIKFIEFIEQPDEIEHARKWLARVAERQEGINLKENDIDLKYLSRFKVTRQCPSNSLKSWWEYIEPLTVHARHPFGLRTCRHPYRQDSYIYKNSNPQIPMEFMFSVDYLLLQSQRDFGSSEEDGHQISPPKAFLFDAGTSRFDSSLSWFVCAYQQVRFLIFF